MILSLKRGTYTEIGYVTDSMTDNVITKELEALLEEQEHIFIPSYLSLKGFDKTEPDFHGWTPMESHWAGKSTLVCDSIEKFGFITKLFDTLNIELTVSEVEI